GVARVLISVRARGQGHAEQTGRQQQRDKSATHVDPSCSLGIYFCEGELTHSMHRLRELFVCAIAPAPICGARVCYDFNNNLVSGSSRDSKTQNRPVSDALGVRTLRAARPMSTNGSSPAPLISALILRLQAGYRSRRLSVAWPSCGQATCGAARRLCPRRG